MDNIQVMKEIRSAIKQGDTQRVRELFTEDMSRLHIDTPFGSWLHVAASAGKLDILELIISFGADVNFRSGIFNAAPINEASSAGHVEIVHYLLDRGAELDVSEPEKNPLFAAIYGGHLDIAKLLVGRGIDWRIKYSGETMRNMDAEAYAIERGQSEIAAYLKMLK